MTDKLAKANRTTAFLNSEEWKEAWEAYRQRIFMEIEKAASDDDKKVMHLKRLLSAATQARTYLEQIVDEGKIAAELIEFEEQQRKFRLFNRQRA
jgi:hypothetical protein